MDHLSERLRELMSDEEFNELRAIERLAHSRTVAAAANNRFPHWDMRTWLQVMTIVSVLAGWIWFASAKWSNVEMAAAELSTVKASISSLSADVASVKAEVKSNHDSTEHRLDEIGRQLADVATEARNAATAARTASWATAGRGRGGQ